MSKRPTKQVKSKSELGNWIDEENRQYEARRLAARINETAQKAHNEFWEFVMGSFPEVANERTPDNVTREFTKLCREAVTSWFMANSQVDDKILSLIKSDAIKPHEKKVMIGQNDEGWWAANPEPAIKHQDIEKIQVIFSGLPSKDQLQSLLFNLGYKDSNILEGILKIR
jgi:hypothetical protein